MEEGEGGGRREEGGGPKAVVAAAVRGCVWRQCSAPRRFNRSRKGKATKSTEATKEAKIGKKLTFTVQQQPPPPDNATAVEKEIPIPHSSLPQGTQGTLHEHCTNTARPHRIPKLQVVIELHRIRPCVLQRTPRFSPVCLFVACELSIVIYNGKTLRGEKEPAAQGQERPEAEQRGHRRPGFRRG